MIIVVGDSVDVERPKGKCFVCLEVKPLDRHHTAPKNMFGAEAESWPIVKVCRSCHVRWHRIVDGIKWSWQPPTDVSDVLDKTSRLGNVRYPNLDTCNGD